MHIHLDEAEVSVEGAREGLIGGGWAALVTLRLSDWPEGPVASCLLRASEARRLAVELVAAADSCERERGR